MLTYGSICSGIEAASVAWKPLGWRCAFTAEIEAFPSAVLAHHHPDAPNLGDMTAIDGAAWCGKLDVLVGGTPCQAFSVAGKRQSLTDDRGNLTLKFVELVHGADPAWVVWENVPGVLSTDDNAFGCFLAGLVGEEQPLVCRDGSWPNAGMVAGPRRTAAWRVLDAQYFRLAQRRRRVFVVSCRTGDGINPGAVLFEPESLPGDSAPSREAGTRVAASLTRGADSGGKGGYAGRRLEDDHNIVVNALDRHMGSGGPDDNAAQANHLITHALRADGFDASEDGTGRGTPLVPCSFDWQSGGSHPTRPPTMNLIEDGTNALSGTRVQAVVYRDDRGRGNDRAITDGTTYPLHAAKGPSEQQVVAFAQNTRDEVRQINGDGQIVGALAAEPEMKQQNYIATPFAFQTRIARNGRGQPEPITPTLQGAEAGATSDMRPCVVAAMSVRRLTPRECERLQGFPDTRRTVIIRACSGDRPKRDVNAVGKSRRSRISVCDADASASPTTARSAASPTNTSHLESGSPVALNVLVNCEVGELRVHSADGASLLFAATVEGDGGLPVPIRLADFVRLAVLTLSTQAPTTPDGKAGSRPLTSDSSVPVNGSNAAIASGGAIEVYADDVANAIADLTPCTKSIISGHGPSSLNCARDLQTLCCCAVAVTSSFIPAETSRANSYCIKLTLSAGYTLIKHRGKPAADGPRYRALGNSMAVPVMRWIGERIVKVINARKVVA